MRDIDGKKPSCGRITIRELFGKYFVCAKHRSVKTDLSRAKPITKHFGDMYADVPKNEFLTVVDQYESDRQREPTARGGFPSLTTLDREMELLSRVLAFGICRGYLAENPLKNHRYYNQPNQRERVLEPDEYQRLLGQCKGYLKLLVTLAYNTGARKGELLALKWSDVDFLASYARISIRARNTKTRTARTVFATQETFELLKEAYQVRKCEYVIENNGKQVKDFRRCFKTACKNADIEGLWFHDHRRSFATQKAREGVDLESIRVATGHKSWSSFRRYNIFNEPRMLAVFGG